MPRYILIDNNSGYIWGDTADLPRDIVIDGETMRDIGEGGLTPTLAARWVDAHVSPGGDAREYEEHGPSYRPDRDGAYHVYRADIDGSEAVATVWDGQDQATIDAVERDCRKVAVVTWTTRAEEI